MAKKVKSEFGVLLIFLGSLFLLVNVLVIIDVIFSWNTFIGLGLIASGVIYDRHLSGKNKDDKKWSKLKWFKKYFG